MKKYGSFCLAAACALALTACSSSSTAEETASESENQTSVEKTTHVVDTENLQVIEIESAYAQGYGISAEMYYDIAKENDYYPYGSEMEIYTMPVYKRTASSAGVPYGLSIDKMNDAMKQVTEKLGLETGEYTVRFAGKDNPDGMPEMTPVSMDAESEDAYVDVDARGSVRVWYKDGYHPQMPKDMDFEYDADDKEAEEVIAYLDKQYGSLLAESVHGYDIGGDYTFDGEQIRKYIIYGISDDDAQTIVNYSFRCVRFYPDEDENLSGILIANELSAAEKVGDYPVISEEEAEELLYKGKYLSESGVDISKSMKIASTTLIYLNSYGSEYQIPYYRFWIDITEQLGGKSTDKLRTYGIYHVPALASEYIKWKDSDTKDTALYPNAKTLTITRYAQQNNWYCGPACGQMVLSCFHINADQSTLASQMNTYNPGDRADGIIGTYDTDVARVLNDYLFGGQPKTSSDGGYRVHALGNSYVKSDYETMLKRVKQNIDDGYPSILQVQPYALYGSGTTGNNNVVVCGYETASGTEYLILADPYYEGESGGFSRVKADTVYRSIIASEEPSYIW